MTKTFKNRVKNQPQSGHRDVDFITVGAFLSKLTIQRAVSLFVSGEIRGSSVGLGALIADVTVWVSIWILLFR